MTEKSKKVILASGNPHKLREMRQLLDNSGVDLVGAGELDGMEEVVEDGETFTDNAVKKAVQVSMVYDLSVLADDSGFAVAALEGEPGVRSARYAGEAATDEENVEKVLSRMRGKKNRSAAFVCVLALACRGELLGTVEGRIEGEVTDAPRGEGGFGYDPVFIPAGHEQTFAEMDSETKNRLSHRAQAVNNLLACDWFIDHYK